MIKPSNNIKSYSHFYKVDLDAIKGRQKSKYTEFIQVRLTKETKEELVDFCERQNISASTLIREMIENYFILNNQK